MTEIYTSEAGERAVLERTLELLARWPVPNEQLRVATREGETFVVACGPKDAPALVLLHGSGANALMWTGDAAAWAPHFRVYAVDMIGEPGLSAPSRPPLESDAYALWLLCPGGVGKLRASFPFKVAPLLLLGRWGRRRAMQVALGSAPGAGRATEGEREIADYVSLIFKHFRPRREKLPTFGDQALRRLAMPLLAIVGARDAMLDSANTAWRLARAVPHAKLCLLPEAGHFIRDQTKPVLDFLLR